MALKITQKCLKYVNWSFSHKGIKTVLVHFGQYPQMKNRIHFEAKYIFVKNWATKKSIIDLLLNYVVDF